MWHFVLHFKIHEQSIWHFRLFNPDTSIFFLQKWERRSVLGSSGQQLKHLTHNLCLDSSSLSSGQTLSAEVCDQSVPGQRWKFNVNSGSIP